MQKPKPQTHDKLANLVKMPGVIVGNAGRLAQAWTFDEAKWCKKWRKRPQ